VGLPTTNPVAFGIAGLAAQEVPITGILSLVEQIYLVVECPGVRSLNHCQALIVVVFTVYHPSQVPDQ
jgi:hypothetical protein